MVVANDNIAVYVFDTVLTSCMQSPKSLAYAKASVQFDTLLIEEQNIATSEHVMCLELIDGGQHAYTQIVIETQEAMWAAHSNTRKL